MKKMITFLMVCVFLLSALPVYAAEVSFDVYLSADKGEASVGDTVHYKVIAKGEDVVALQFDVAIPDGMEYVVDSAAAPKELKNELGVAGVGWTEKTMRFSFYNDKGVQIPEGTVLLTFECVVAAEGLHQVSLSGVAPYNSEFAAIQPTIQLDTVAVGNVSGGVENQIQPLPPETTDPDDTTNPAPDEVLTPGVSGGSEGNTGSVDTVPPETGAADQPIVDSSGNAGSSTGNGTGNSGTVSDGSSVDTPSIDVIDPVGGTTGSSTGSSGSASTGSADAPSGTVSSGSTSSSVTVTDPDSTVSNTQGANSGEGVSTDAPALQPGEDMLISAPENGAETQKNEQSGTPETTPDQSVTTIGPETEETTPTESPEEDKGEESSFGRTWLIVGAAAILAAVLIFFVIRKKKQ